MANPKFDTPENYISSFPENVQTILKKVRSTIQKAVPDAEEVISYNIPAFKHHGWLIYYSGYKQHFSLSIPPPFDVFPKFKKELAAYEQSKSAIRFPFDEPVPVKLIEAIARFRASENIKLEGLRKKSEKPKGKSK